MHRGSSQTSSNASPSVPTSTYGILTSGVQPSSIVPQRVDSLPTCITVSPISLAPQICFDDQKSFKRFICLAASKSNGAIGDDAYEILLDCQERLHKPRSIVSRCFFYDLSIDLRGQTEMEISF